MLAANSLSRAVVCVFVFGVMPFAVWEGCSVYDESLLTPSNSDGGTKVSDTGTPDSGSDGDTCAHVRWPARPSADTKGPGTIEFYTALASLDFGMRDAAPPPVLGFDLDNVCTCPGPESCVPGSQEVGHCDQDGGIDDSAQNLILQFSAYPGFFGQDYINQRINQGYYGALMRVRGYNGGPNDTQVELAFFSSNGTEGIQKGTPTMPKGDVNDKWTIDPGSVLGGAILGGSEPVPSTGVDVSAYVANGKLVANLDVPLSVGGNGDSVITIQLTGSVLVATIVSNGDGSYRLDDGVLTGRWQARKALTALAALPDPLNPTENLCGTNTTYLGLKQQICKYPDVPSNVLDDNKSAPCDAISLAFTFKARPGGYGSVYAQPDAGANNCGAQWTDTCPP